MAYASQVKYEQADENVKKIWDQQVANHGRMTNMKCTLAHSFTALRSYMEWYPLKDEVTAFTGERAAIIFAHALSSETDCLICSTYFRRTLTNWGEDPDHLKLNEPESELVDYAKATLNDANNIPPEIMKKLKVRYSDKQMVLLTAFAGIMIATNIFNNALQVELDDYLFDYKK